MTERSVVDSDFMNRLTALIGENISNEEFGVSELSHEMHMSRSNLLRKVKKITGLSVNHLIREIRLKRGMDLLRTSTLNVTEVADAVGFGSPSYFIKCFRERYGYPPGEAANHPEHDPEEETISIKPAGNADKKLLLATAVVVAVAIAGILFYLRSPEGASPGLVKSIAVLPFKNDSHDSSNIYLVNGLMESTLGNLQKISDLKVVSRTTAESYRNTSLSIPEMARELGVMYFVEGSGQKIGNKILLNIQLIEGPTDRHLWAKQYRSETTDIFRLQEEVARNIADEIEAIITPEEEKLIQKRPTADPVAYDHYLKAKDLFYRGGRGDLEASLPWYRQAVEKDPDFALAYASMTMVYYYLDMFNTEKKYGLEVDNYSARAVELDPRLAESMVAKALSFVNRKEYEKAVAALEQGLEYDPHSGIVLHFLVEFYSVHVPNSSRYLEYALRKVKLDIPSRDSATTGYNYLHFANALMQSGFKDPALAYINKSLDFNPADPIARYLKTYILLAIHGDFEQTRDLLLEELGKDTTRFDLLQEVGKVYYYMGDYPTAYKYYRKFLDIRTAWKLDIFRFEDMKIGIVLEKVGKEKEARQMLEGFRKFAETDKTIYKHLGLSVYYAHTGDRQKAIGHLDLFSKEENFLYWVLLLKDEPAFDSIRDDPDFKRIVGKIEEKFWRKNREIAKMLKREGVI